MAAKVELAEEEEVEGRGAAEVRTGPMVKMAPMDRAEEAVLGGLKHSSCRRGCRF